MPASYFPGAVERMSAGLRGALRDNGWWNPQADVVQPSLLRHPETGLATLQLYTFTRRLSAVAHEACGNDFDIAFAGPSPARVPQLHTTLRTPCGIPYLVPRRVGG